MRILTRYLIRSHTGPFVFAFTLLTGLLFVNAIAQRLERLVGKGLPLDIVAEFVLLALPHTIALTLPLAVLVAVLYTFSDMAAASEIIAMSAGGVRPRTLLLPTLVGATFLAGVTYAFNDQILPEANHRLKNLSISISQKSPTFQLRERVVNQIDTEDGSGPYFLKAAAIDPVSSELTDVVIYDVSQPGIRRTTYASRGEMSLNGSFTDLHLRLYDGRVYEVGSGELGTFQQTEFDRQLYVLRGVGDVLEIHDGDQRTDREMSVAMLREEVHSKRGEYESVRDEARARSVQTVERALGLGPIADSLRNVEVAPAVASMVKLPALPPDAMTQTVAVTTRTNASRLSALQRQVNKHEVEIQKKFTIAFACIVFVLIGAPIGVRFPRGGVGMVISVSAFVIAVYWMGLIGGEKLADEGLADPFWVMWAPNLVFLVVGLFMVSRMGRWIASARGGGWREVWMSVGAFLVAPFRRRRRAA